MLITWQIKKMMYYYMVQSRKHAKKKKTEIKEHKSFRLYEILHSRQVDRGRM